MINLLASTVQLMLPMAEGDCIPNNDIFTTPLAPVFSLIVGGVGGLLLKYGIVLVLVFLLVRAILNIIKSKNAKEDISAMAVVLIAFISVILIIVLASTILTAMNGMCATLTP